MSSSLTIPEDRREGFISIARLDKEASKEIFHCLAAIPVGMFDRESIMRAALSCELKLTNKKVTQLVVETVLSLLVPLIESGKTINVFLADLMAAVDENIEVGKISLNLLEKERLEANLLVLLKVPSLGISVKANSVLFENEKSLTSSRVLSEVRPVFGLEEDEIGGAVIIHTLRLEYFTKGDGGQKDFYVHLDDDDLDDLISRLHRAKNKSVKIKEMLEASSTPLIDEEI